MATEDARYCQSTQYRLWSFSPAQLAQLREKTNALARTNISERLSSPPPSAPSRNLSPPAGAVTTPQPAEQAQQPPSDSSLPEFLAPAEERQLLDFFTVELLRAAAFCELPTDIRATAAIFLRRFYVTNSVMTYPPTELLKTCLFFGAKAEGFYTRLGQFAEKFPNTTPAEILAGEFLLCQGIRFAFDVRHPYRALEGAIMELRQYGDLDPNKINTAHARAREILKFSTLVTDAYFHYTPSQIMLAALSLADASLLDRLLQETFPQGPQGTAAGDNAAAQARSATRDNVAATIAACSKMLAAEPPERMQNFWGSPESNKLVRPLIRKLKKCRDPDRWDLVALQKAKREQALGRKVGSDGTAGGSKTQAGAAAEANTANGGVLGEAGRDAKRRKTEEDPFGGAL